MRKLKLEEIEVDSIFMEKTSKNRGTVVGQEMLGGLLDVTDPVSKSCESNASWFGPPQVCCAM